MNNAAFDLATARFAVLEAARKAVEVLKANGKMDQHALAEALGVDLLGCGPTDLLLFGMAHDAATEYLAQSRVVHHRKPVGSPSLGRKLTQ